jgi:hypothetical protein
MVLIHLSIEKCVFSCWFGATATALSLNLTYIWRVPSKLSLGSQPCTNPLCSTFQLSCPYSISYVISPKNLAGSEILTFHNKLIFYAEGLLAPRTNPKLKDHSLLFVCGCLFSMFTAMLHCWRLSLHPQLEEMLYCGDKGPHIVFLQQRASVTSYC